MKTAARFLACVAAGYALVFVMTRLVPHVPALRQPLVLGITFIAILAFYLWEAPAELGRFNLRLALVLVPVVAALTLYHHTVVEQNLAPVHALPSIVAAAVPFACGWVYRRIRRRALADDAGTAAGGSA